MVAAAVGRAQTFLSVGGTISDFAFTPDTATASLTINSDGTITSSGSVSSVSTVWVSPAPTGIGSQFEVRATETSGSLTSGTTDTWLALTSNRVFSLTQASAGFSICDLLIEIRRVSNLETVGSATFNLEASVESGA